MSEWHLGSEDSREYPKRPIVGVAGVVIRGDEVLLIRRGREPRKGAWSLPGGALLLSEPIEEGVRREVLEETGLRVHPLELVEVLDRIVLDASGRTQYHYVLLDWLCSLEKEASADQAGSAPRASSDAAEARWVDRSALSAYDLEPFTLRIIAKAAVRARELSL